MQNPVVSFLFDSFRISRDIYERLICQMYEKYLVYNTHGTESVHMHKKLFISFLSFSTHSVPRTMTITKWKRVIHKYYFNFITVKNTTDIRISKRTSVTVWGKAKWKRSGRNERRFQIDSQYVVAGCRFVGCLNVFHRVWCVYLPSRIKCIFYGSTFTFDGFFLL